MEFDLTIGSMKEFPNSFLVYNQSFLFSKKNKIFIHHLKCPDCDKKRIGHRLEHILHGLEHEIVEMVSNKIRYDDGEKDFCVHGFDSMFHKCHTKIVKHICKGECTVTYYG